MRLRFHDFIRSWFALVAKVVPSVEELDLPAFEQALSDLADGETDGDFTADGLEALADWMLDLSDSLLADLQQELARDAVAARAGAILTILFLRRCTQDIDPTVLREARRRACDAYVKLLTSHIERVAERRRRKLAMREHRRRRKLVDGLAVEPQQIDNDPANEVAAREIAQRVVDRVKASLKENVFSFLRASVVRPDFVAIRSASEFRTSPSSLTRARDRLRQVIEDEREDLVGVGRESMNVAIYEAFQGK